jgi:hypothetical protein
LSSYALHVKPVRASTVIEVCRDFDFVSPEAVSPVLKSAAPRAAGLPAAHAVANKKPSFSFFS